MKGTGHRPLAASRDPATGRVSPGCRRRSWLRLLRERAGTTTLEWALLLGFIAIPSYWLFTMALATLVEHYRMISFVNSLPFP